MDSSGKCNSVICLSIFSNCLYNFEGSMFLAPNYSVFPPTEILDENAKSKTEAFSRIGCKKDIFWIIVFLAILFILFGCK